VRTFFGHLKQFFESIKIQKAFCDYRFRGRVRGNGIVQYRNHAIEKCVLPSVLTKCVFLHAKSIWQMVAWWTLDAVLSNARLVLTEKWGNNDVVWDPTSMLLNGFLILASWHIPPQFLSSCIWSCGPWETQSKLMPSPHISRHLNTWRDERGVWQL